MDRGQAARLRGAAEGTPWAQGLVDYDATPFAERAPGCSCEHSTFFAFGTEESYGYLPNDYVRDKDGNAACLMFAELCAWVKGRGLTVPEYLDELYVRHGFFLEGAINIYYEGASGSAKIRRILDTYRTLAPPGVRRCGGRRIPGLRPGAHPRRRRRARSRSRTSTSSRWRTATASRRAAAAPSRR